MLESTFIQCRYDVRTVVLQLLKLDDIQQHKFKLEAFKLKMIDCQWIQIVGHGLARP